MQASKLRAATAAASEPMILEFDTSLGDLSVQLPLYGTVNVVVDWGDGTSSTYTTTGIKSHAYATGGIYQVTITGVLTEFGNISTRPELTKCLSFGTLGLTSLRRAFYDCANLTVAPDTLPATVTNIEQMFALCTSFNYDIGGWDVSNVTDMREFLSSAASFNQDIGGWNVSSAQLMGYMFADAVSFNQNIGAWDVSNVINMYSMFAGASAFNQNIGAWDTSKVFTMTFMFADATSFNQDIGGWDVSNVTDMGVMFENATSFNQDLSGWCVGNISVEPGSFSTGSALTVGNKPVWGTCPSYVASGSITYIGEATGTTSATLPSHQAGDLILAFAFRDGSTTFPTQPSGWTTVAGRAGTSASARTAYKVAASGGEATGTWTNASTVIFLVYRGVNTTDLVSINAAGDTSGVGTTVTYYQNGCWQNLSRVVAFAGHRSVDTALGTPPGSLTLIVNPVDATDEAAAFQSTVDNFGNWTSTNVSVGGTSSGWITFVMRLRVPIVPV